MALAVSGLMGVTILCLVLCFYWSEQRQLRLEADQERQLILHNLTHIARESFLTNDDLLLVKYTRWLARWNPSLVSASVVDNHGEVQAHSEPTLIGQAGNPNGASSSKLLVLTEPVRIGNYGVGTASVAFSEERLESALAERTGELVGRLKLVSLTALGLGLCLCLMIALSWTRPIGQLVQVTEQIGKGDWRLNLRALSRRGDEIGALSRACEQMAGQLKELDHLKEDFVSAVTHELRSPLGAIESYLNLIAQEMSEGIPAATWASYLDRLRINTQRLGRFVNDLLDVAALERGKIKLDLQPVNVVTIAQDVLGLFALKLKEKSLTYKVVGVSGMPPVLADPDKIRQVLVNLVSNAIKFTPPEGSVEIRIEAAPNGGVSVQVIDTGWGISPEDQCKIFNRFEQVRSARRHVQGPKGTGLGLAISKALVELHGQKLQVVSRPGEGSIFSFALPFVAERSAA